MSGNRIGSGGRIIAAVLLLCAAVLAYAWIDGGREPPHPISEPVPVPGTKA